jgi:Kef-type K+ transport system membrane component KefB
VGITARVLSDLGRAQDPESRIVLGAAVFDDIIGLIILTVVSQMIQGDPPTALGVAVITARAFGFLLVTLLVGGLVIPWVARRTSAWDVPGTLTILAVILALGLAYLAEWAGSAMIIGAFAAGLLLARVPQVHGIEKGVAQLGYFFVPIFFVYVGAAVDVRKFNPLEADGRWMLAVGGVLIVLAVVGKYVAGYAPWWFAGNKKVIGVAMVPRGEVGLIFAAEGLKSGKLDEGLYGAITLMVLVTTFIVPPLLGVLFPRRPNGAPAPAPEGIEEMVTEAP